MTPEERTEIQNTLLGLNMRGTIEADVITFAQKYGVFECREILETIANGKKGVSKIAVFRQLSRKVKIEHDRRVTAFEDAQRHDDRVVENKALHDKGFDPGKIKTLHKALWEKWYKGEKCLMHFPNMDLVEEMVWGYKGLILCDKHAALALLEADYADRRIARPVYDGVLKPADGPTPMRNLLVREEVEF